MKKLEILCNEYKNNKNKYSSDDSTLISFDDKWFNNYLVSLSLMKVNNEYNIYLYIEENKRIILKALIESSDILIKQEYDKIRGNLQVLDINEFIDMYYDKLIKNFK